MMKRRIAIALEVSSRAMTGNPPHWRNKALKWKRRPAAFAHHRLRRTRNWRGSDSSGRQEPRSFGRPFGYGSAEKEPFWTAAARQEPRPMLP